MLYNLKLSLEQRFLLCYIVTITIFMLYNKKVCYIAHPIDDPNGPNLADESAWTVNSLLFRPEKKIRPVRTEQASRSDSDCS